MYPKLINLFLYLFMTLIFFKIYFYLFILKVLSFYPFLFVLNLNKSNLILQQG